MGKETVMRHIDNLNDNIKTDKDRLSNIINILNGGKDNSYINDKLLDSLTNIEFDNQTYAMANEYITLLLGNIQTQKITYNKEVTEELIKILNHNLNLLNALEDCFIALTSSNDNNILERRKEDIETTHNRRKEDSTWRVLLNALKPTTKLSNIFLWGSIMVTFLTMGYLVDKHFYEHTKNTTYVLKDAIHSEKKLTTARSKHE